MNETYGHSKATYKVNHPRNIAAKVGNVTGTAAMALSWAIDVRLIDTTPTISLPMLAIGALIGLLCVAVSVMFLRNV